MTFLPQSEPDAFHDRPWPVDIHGRPMAPDDPFLQIARQRAQWARGGIRSLGPLRAIARGVGRHMPNDPQDVAAMEVLLHNAGHYDLDCREGPTGYGSPTVDDAILRFQKANGLTSDGWAGPGGETEQALRQTAGVLRVSSQQEVRPSDIGSALPNLLDIEPGLQLARLNKRELPYQRSWQGLEGGFVGGGRGGGRSPQQQPAPTAKPSTEPPASPQVAPRPLPNRPLTVPAPTVHPDALQDEMDGGIADYLTRGIDVTMDYPGWGPRGSDKTQAKNNVVARECRRVIEDEFLDGYAGEHSAGAWQDGTGKYLSEEVVRRPGSSSLLESVRPDLTWKIATPDGRTETVRLNTVDTRGNGNPTGRERRALERLRNYLKNDLADWMAKGDDDPDSPGFAMRARAKCREIFGKYVRMGSGG